MPSERAGTQTRRLPVLPQVKPELGHVKTNPPECPHFCPGDLSKNDTRSFYEISSVKCPLQKPDTCGHQNESERETSSLLPPIRVRKPRANATYIADRLPSPDRRN